MVVGESYSINGTTNYFFHSILPLKLIILPKGKKYKAVPCRNNFFTIHYYLLLPKSISDGFSEKWKSKTFPNFVREGFWLREKGAGVRWTPLCKAQKHRPRRQPRPWTNDLRVIFLRRRLKKPLAVPEEKLPWSVVFLRPRRFVLLAVSRTASARNLTQRATLVGLNLKSSI